MAGPDAYRAELLRRPGFAPFHFRPDPETWADAMRLAREEYGAWLAARRARRYRRMILAGRLVLALAVLLHLALTCLG